jgi:threonine dehydrogenase-like Zn-dependent dehydrogenase
LSPSPHAFFEDYGKPTSGGNTKVKGWYLHGVNDMRLEQVAPPTLKEGYLLAEVLCAQPSVTETQMVAGIGNPYGFQDRLRKEGRIPLPGHEYCARVIKTDKGSKFRIGDRVAGIAKIACGVCAECRAGFSMVCKDAHLMGVTLPGCFSELVSLPERGLVRIDDALSHSEGACLQPIGDCVAAVDTAAMSMGDTVAIFGQGCMGINLLQVARASGAGTVIAVDIRDEILTESAHLGANHIINSKNSDPIGTIRELTDGRGADAIFEAAGGDTEKGLAGTETIRQSIDAVRDGGKIIVVSYYGQPVEMPMDSLRMRGVQIISPKMSTTGHLLQAMRLVASGQVLLKSIVTQVLSGIEAVPRAFEITGHKGRYNSIMPAQVIIAS